MSAFAIAAVLILGLLGLIVLRMPIALAMGVVGAAGYVSLSSAANLMAYLSTAWVDKFLSYEFAVVPLFILMGQLATHSGLSATIFAAAKAWIGHRRGGLAMAAVAGCALFGSISGSSLATASTMTRVALPEMRKHGFSDALSAGALASGGTLGILIPPSLVLILYGLITEQNIVSLFVAAVVPAVMAVIGFVLAIAVYVRLFPAEGPVSPRVDWRHRLRALREVWPVLVIFVLVLGGIYGGAFTPTQGAALGVVLTALLGAGVGQLSWAGLIESLAATAAATAMIFAILFGADLFNVALALSRVPGALAGYFSTANIAPYAVLLAMVAVYLLLGCVMDSLSMILLTVPVFFPVVMVLDFGLPPDQVALWFGIVSLVVVELGLITPPVGMNLFVISAIARDIPMRAIYQGALPFIAAEIIRVGLLIGFPALSLGLVRLWG